MIAHQINVEVTSRCRGRCPFCYERGCKFEGRELDASAHSQISKNLPKCENIVFTGGDPLERDDILSIIRCYARLGKNLILLTTPFSFNEKLARALSELDVHIQLPLHSVEKNLDRILGCNAWNKTLTSIKLMKDVGNDYSFSFVLTSNNLSDVEKTALSAIKLGASSFLFIRMLALGSGSEKKEYMPSVRDIESSLDVLDCIAQDFGFPVISGTPLPPCTFPRRNWKNIVFAWCSAGDTTITVNPYGKYVFCPASDYQLGDALLQKWEIMNERLYPAECEGCEYLIKCRGGCKASIFNTYKRWDMREFV